MGRQDSLIQLNGSVGNISFYKSKEDGYLARKKGGVSAKRIKSDPAYARTRENMAEFSRAGQASKLLRTAFRLLLRAASDKRVTSRLTGTMATVIQTDAINRRGQRSVMGGRLALLEGFEFNRHAVLTNTISAQFAGAIERSTGTMTVDVPSLVPSASIAAPDGATHYRFKAGGAALDFQGKTSVVDIAESDAFELDAAIQEATQLSVSVTPDSPHTLVLVFGIEFLQIVNGEESVLNNGAYNAMAIVKVDQPES